MLAVKDKEKFSGGEGEGWTQEELGGGQVHRNVIKYAAYLYEILKE